MSVIPLDIQRRYEQRWAARFFQPTPNTPQRQFERQDQELATPSKAKQQLTGSSRKASEPQRGERGTEARALVDRVSGSPLS